MPSQLEKQLSTIKKVMVENLNKNFVPFPVNRAVCSKWTENLPYAGDTILYTSYMYQLSSLFKSYEKHIPTFSNMGGSTKIASLGRLLIRPKKEDLERSYKILRNISSLISKAGVQHGYLYHDEPYSGGLLLELGMLDEFREYGKKVLQLFDEKGVKRVITVDPHTNNAMVRLKEMHGSDLEIVNYLSLIRGSKGKGEFVLHDPCLYTRYNNLGNVMRNALKESGVRLKENRMITSKEYGTCCGGPLGPVDLELSDKIAKNRAENLLTVSDNVMVACPLCYQNLSAHVKNLKDIAEVIS